MDLVRLLLEIAMKIENTLIYQMMQLRYALWDFAGHFTYSFSTKGAWKCWVKTGQIKGQLRDLRNESTRNSKIS